MNELLVLLLPLAAFSGWWLARNGRHSGGEQKEDDYFKGLSYLLEDETDKAIDIFFRIAHLDSSTLENQITLGNLFRHRGEIDRALHIHSHLLDKADPADEETRQKLNLALADDHLAAGIMNHAEDYYQKVRHSTHADMRNTARRKLVSLYAEQNRWSQAIEVATELDPFNHDKNLQQQVAHYHCEIAKDALKEAAYDEAEDGLQRALQCDKNCVRATLKLGRLAAKQQHFVTAIGYFHRVEKQNPSFLPEILDDLAACYRSLEQQHEWKIFLLHLVKHYYNPVLMLRFNMLIAETEGQAAALTFLRQQLSEKPNMLALQAFVALVDDGSNKDIHLLNKSIEKTLSHALKYRCSECGFRGNKLDWQCPGCKSWGTFTPVSDVSLKENIG